MPDKLPRSATFTCLVQPGGLVVCRVEGDIVASGHAIADEAFADALDLARTGVIVDCARAGRCDATVVTALLQLRQDALAREVALVLAGADHELLRMFELAGAKELLPAYPSLGRALDALAARRPRADESPFRASHQDYGAISSADRRSR